MDSSIVHIQNGKITIMTAPLIGGQVTGNDTIDLLRPTLNLHESHCGRISKIIMH